jgi:hypothetical protein
MNKPMIIQSEAERRAKIIKRAYSILPVISLSRVYKNSTVCNRAD